MNGNCCVCGGPHTFGYFFRGRAVQILRTLGIELREFPENADSSCVLCEPMIVKLSRLSAQIEGWRFDRRT